MASSSDRVHTYVLGQTDPKVRSTLNAWVRELERDLRMPLDDLVVVYDATPSTQERLMATSPVWTHAGKLPTTIQLRPDVPAKTGTVVILPYLNRGLLAMQTADWLVRTGRIPDPYKRVPPLWQAIPQQDLRRALVLRRLLPPDRWRAWAPDVLSPLAQRILLERNIFSLPNAKLTEADLVDPPVGSPEERAKLIQEAAAKGDFQRVRNLLYRGLSDFTKPEPLRLPTGTLTRFNVSPAGMRALEALLDAEETRIHDYANPQRNLLKRVVSLNLGRWRNLARQGEQSLGLG